MALAAHAAGELPLSLLVASLTTGPAAVLGRPELARGLTVGGAARLVVVDRDASWTVRRDTLVGRSANTPLLGRTLRGAVQLTMLHGSVAWQAGTTS